MAVKFATGFRAHLTSNIGTTNTALPISASDAARLCRMLGTGNSTYLVLDNGAESEVIGATCVGGRVVITRGANPIAAMEGSCVKFEVTDKLIDEYRSPDEAQDVCEIEGANGITVERDGCKVTVRLGSEDCENSGWRSGNYNMAFEDGCIVATPAETCRIAPGVYRNATITVDEDGVICKIEEGNNIVYSQSHCCTCGEPLTEG